MNKEMMKKEIIDWIKFKHKDSCHFYLLHQYNLMNEECLGRLKEYCLWAVSAFMAESREEFAEEVCGNIDFEKLAYSCNIHKKRWRITLPLPECCVGTRFRRFGKIENCNKMVIVFGKTHDESRVEIVTMFPIVARY